MYYNDNLNRTGSININGNVNTNAGQRDDNGNTGAPLFSQSYDPSMLSNQDWQQSVDDQLANYLALDPTGFTSQSLDSSFLNDAFGGPSDWQGWNDFGGSFGSNINHQQQQQQQQPFKHGVGGGGGGGSGGQQENLFLNLGEPEQQAILLSDPNFMRQQQLLQEQQREMQMRIQEHEQQDEMGSEQNRSNLSAMLDQTEGDNSKSADSSIVPSSFARQQQQRQQLPQAPLPPAQPSAKAAGKAPTRKEHNRRSYNGGGSLSKTNRANPIPISGKASSTRATSSSSVPTEIDHQRRLNELQARFRINYARKPNQRSQKPQPSQATTSVMSSSFSGLSMNQFAAENMLGTSMPSNLTPGSKDSSSSADAEAGPERRRAASLTIEQNPAMTTIRFSHPPGSSAGSGSSGKLVTAPRNQPSNPPPSFPSRTMPIQIQRVQRPNQSLPFDAELRQKKLDDQLEKVDFDDITVSELKEMLRQRGKPATGKKAILLQRLQEERDMIKAARSGRIPRQTAQQSGTECGRPKSFAGTVPIPPQGMPHPSSPGSRASSVPDSQGFIPPLGSPGSVTSSLNWSIENMHIGSPPPISSQQARRYAPYGNPSSPRLGSAGSPKMYSTSVPTGYFSSSPSQHDFGRAIRPYRYPAIPGKHKYAPHTSSALATPDHEEEINPFDQIMQQEAVKVEDPPSMSSTGMEGLQWDPPIEEVLQQGTGNAELGRLTEEELLSLLASQQFNADSMALDTPPSQKVQNGLDFSNVLFEDSMFDDSKGRQEWYK